MRALLELVWDLIMNSVFIVDDHPVIRLAVRMLLEHEGYKVVGETDNGVDAMQMVRECMPDLVILDISIPKLDGLEVLARFNAMSTPLKTLVLTAQCPTLFGIRCMQSGASGYVCKQEAFIFKKNYFFSEILNCKNPASSLFTVLMADSIYRFSRWMARWRSPTPALPYRTLCHSQL